MGLYKLFSCNVEIQYKSCLLSKATLFTLITTIINIVLPFIIAYRSKGFWLRAHSYYEQPVIHFTYEYILIAETDDPSQTIVCGETVAFSQESISGEENCVQIQVQENDNNADGNNDSLELHFRLNVPAERTITSVVVILALDFQLRTVCQLHMQSLAVVDKLFVVPTSGWKFYGDIEFYQVQHLPCLHNVIDTEYNTSLLSYKQNVNENVVDFILKNYIQRKITTPVKTLHSRNTNGQIGEMGIYLNLRIPEMKINYVPSLLQEFKWAWPQYLSLVVIFYWILNKIRSFVFYNRLLMAWEVVPWKKLQQ